MKKYSKIVLSALCAMCLVAAFALAGCGSSESSKTTEAPATDTTKTTESTTANADAVELSVFAANSLQKALPEVQALYTEANPNVTFADTQFEASGTLVEKLQGGGTADLLICASKSSMDTAEKNGSIDTATRSDMFTNDLVICAAEGSTVQVTDIASIATNPDITKIFIGDPDVVPAGKYALQALASAGLATYDTEASKLDDTIVWADSIKDKIEMGSDKVGTVAKNTQATAGSVGFIYTSDIYRYDGVTSIFTTPADSHKAIVYPGAVCTSAKNADESAKFMKFCVENADAQKIFSEYGFELA